MIKTDRRYDVRPSHISFPKVFGGAVRHRQRKSKERRMKVEKDKTFGITGISKNRTAFLLTLDRSRHLIFTIVMRKIRSEEHTSELQSRFDIVCRLLL